MDQEKVSLASLMGGMAVERFDDALAQVLANIVDPNTAPMAKREVVLKVEFKPDRGRGLGKVAVQVQSKLAPPEKVETTVFFSMTRGGPVATEHNPNQMRLPLEAPESGPVHSQFQPLRPVGGAK